MENVTELLYALQEDDLSDDEEPSNEAYNEAGILTAHLSQLLDLRLVAGPKPSLPDSKPSDKSNNSFPSPKVQPNGSQQPEQQQRRQDHTTPELTMQEQKVLHKETRPETGLKEKAEEDNAAAVTPLPIKIIPGFAQLKASQNGLLPGNTSFKLRWHTFMPVSAKRNTCHLSLHRRLTHL